MTFSEILEKDGKLEVLEFGEKPEGGPYRGLVFPGRLERTGIPSGVNIYEIRSDEDLGAPVSTIEERVLVNFGGTLITKDELVRDGEGFFFNGNLDNTAFEKELAAEKLSRYETLDEDEIDKLESFLGRPFPEIRKMLGKGLNTAFDELGLTPAPVPEKNTWMFNGSMGLKDYLKEE